MRRFLALLLVFAQFSLIAPAGHAGVLAMKGKTLVGDCAQDGAANAPAGTPLYASRRATWAFPPTCLVPDVDYNVGPDPAVTLLDPSTASLPTGLNWNATEHRLDCSGGVDGVVIQNYDFTLVSGGNGGVLINGCNNVVIRNLKMVGNCNDPAHTPFAIKQLGNSTNVSISKVSIDGGGINGWTCSQGESIYLNGPGLQSITYSRIINASEHNISFACTASACTAYARYNSISATGFGQGEHDNTIQWLGDAYSASDVSYNYTYNPQPSVALEAAANLTIDTTLNSTAATLHMAAGVTQSSLLQGMTITSANVPGGTTLATVGGAGNPISVTLSAQATATASGVSAAIPNAYPIGLLGVRYVAQGAAPNLNGLFVGNIFDGDGPIKGTTYAISCGGSSGIEMNGVTINGNYLNPAGASGGLFTKDTFCLNVSGSANKSLTTGATIPVP